MGVCPGTSRARCWPTSSGNMEPGPELEWFRGWLNRGLLGSVVGGCGGWFSEVSLNMVPVLLSCRFSSCRFVFIEVFWCRDDDGVVVVLLDVVPEVGEIKAKFLLCSAYFNNRNI